MYCINTAGCTCSILDHGYWDTNWLLDKLVTGPLTGYWATGQTGYWATNRSRSSEEQCTDRGCVLRSDQSD